MSEKIEITKMADLPKVPITVGDMSFNRTGLWRFLTPTVHERVAPCRAACPLGMPSPGFINDLLRQETDGALDRILRVNPMPGLTSRLCFHPCQSKCLRKEVDDGIRIQELERYVADNAVPASAPTPGEAPGRVAVLGAGPLGLSAAYFLGLAGLEVSILDPLDLPGGFLTSLDSDKLPAEVLERETDRITGCDRVRPVLGEDYATLEADPESRGWGLIIHDLTAHGPESQAGESLAKVADRLSGDFPVLTSRDVCPKGTYKASQIAQALADGRLLAAQALNRLSLTGLREELTGLIQAVETEDPIQAKDIRFEEFEPCRTEVGKQPNAPLEGLDQALAEAERCMSCGSCNACGRCLVFCPDVSLSVDEEQRKVVVDLMHCKGCGICAYECPRQALTMKR